jgi:regulator of cell morphogenesis and NO signaling
MPLRAPIRASKGKDAMGAEIMTEATTVGRLVAERPSRARVFERFGIDYCCGGGRSLEEASASAGVAVDRLLAELEAVPALAGDRDWTRATIRETVEHILREHHDWLRVELPRIDGLAEKVARVHGDGHPEVVEILSLFRILRAELEPHMEKEEQILFPAAVGLEEQGEIVLGCHGRIATLDGPVQRMEHEHREVGELLERLVQLTGGHVAPDHACNTWRALWDSLLDLDRNTRAHIHLENDVLHVRIRALEAVAPGA